MCWLTPQGNCTHPEDMKLCTVIMKSNGSFPVNRRRMVSVQVRDSVPSFCPHNPRSWDLASYFKEKVPPGTPTLHQLRAHSSCILPSVGTVRYLNSARYRHTSLLGDMTRPCNLPKKTIGAISTAQAPAMLSVIPSNPHVTLGSKSYWSTAHRRGSQGSWSTGSSPKSEQLVLGMSWSPDLCDF